MFYDKAELYFNIDKALIEHGIDNSKEIFNLESLIKLCDIDIKYTDFKSDAIGALLIKGEQKSGMMINSTRPLYDQNFDMAHEFIHYLLHPSSISFSFATLVKDKRKEWQANEGAAQILLPYKDFIPRLIAVAYFAQKVNEPLKYIRKNLSEYYNVNYDVIDYRMHNLSKEILQYLNGVELNKIQLTPSEKLLIKTDKTYSALSLTSRIHRML